MRAFAHEGVDPFDEIEWDTRAAVIGNEKGEVVFEQRDVVEIRSVMRSAGARCGVVGLGFVGTSTLRFLAASGVDVVGYDRSEPAVAKARAAIAADLGSEARWKIGTDPTVLATVSTVFVTVRLAPDGQGRFGTEPLEVVAATLQHHGADGQLVLIESTLPPGMTRRFAGWLDRPGMDVAHAPERLRIGDTDATLRAVPRLVGGLTPRATERGCAALVRVGLRPVPVTAPEVSELSKLLENAFLTTNIALVGEMTKLAVALGVPVHDVTAAAATKGHGFMPFHPGPGIGGHCLRNDLDLLRETAAGLGASTPMLDGIANVAASLPELVLRRLEQRLKTSGRRLPGATVLLVGVGFKPGSPDATETPAAPLCRLLRAAGAKVAYTDQLVPTFVVDGLPVPSVPGEELGGASPTAIVILAGDRAINADALRRTGACLLDAGGGGTMPGSWAADERL